MSLERHESIDIHREASRGIANLLSSFRHQATIIEDGLPGLVRLAFSQDEECSYNAAMSFRKLAPNLKSHPVLVYAGAYKALFHLMKLPHQNTQRQAAAALRDLSANPEYKLRCAEDGGIPVIRIVSFSWKCRIAALIVIIHTFDIPYFISITNYISHFIK